MVQHIREDTTEVLGETAAAALLEDSTHVGLPN